MVCIGKSIRVGERPAPLLACLLLGALARVASAGLPALRAEHVRLTATGVHVVRLRRRLMPVSADDSAGGPNASSAAAQEKSFYVGRILVGQPPVPMQVAFDTASGQVVLPSWRCKSAACLQRTHYVPEASATSTDINANGVPVVQGRRLVGRLASRDAISIGLSSLDLGDGKASGELVRESVCIRAQGEFKACTEIGLVAATQMTDAPFKAMPHDGIVGLGLGGLSIGPLFNFVGRLGAGSSTLPAQFGIFLGRHGGEIAFGGYNPARIADPLLWSPVVHPEEGYWQVRIRSIRVGNRTVDECAGAQGCRGILDSGTTRLGVPPKLAGQLEAALAVQHSLGGEAARPCQGQDLHIELEEGMVLTLRAEDYTQGSICSPLLAPLQLPERFGDAFVLGELLLKRYYAVFDAANLRIGFSNLVIDSEAFDPAEEAQQDLQDKRDLTVAAAAAAAAVAAIVESEAVEAASIEARGLAMFLCQAVAMQAVAVLLLGILSTYARFIQVGFMRFQTMLARRGLLPASTGSIVMLPHNEVPEGDECVICLGVCEEECAGISSCCPSGRVKSRPPWCRLQCGHRFHEQCIFEWLWKVQQCPICRAHVKDPLSLPWVRRNQQEPGELDARMPGGSGFNQ